MLRRRMKSLRHSVSSTLKVYREQDSESVFALNRYQKATT